MPSTKFVRVPQILIAYFRNKNNGISEKKKNNLKKYSKQNKLW